MDLRPVLVITNDESTVLRRIYNHWSTIDHFCRKNGLPKFHCRRYRKFWNFRVEFVPARKVEFLIRDACWTQIQIVDLRRQAYGFMKKLFLLEV